MPKVSLASMGISHGTPPLTVVYTQRQMTRTSAYCSSKERNMEGLNPKSPEDLKEE
jgi:hypothetical protein